MGEHDAARFGLDGELHKLFAIGVAAEFKAFHAGFDFGFNVGGFEEEGVAGGGGEEFAARSFGITVADEADGVTGIAQKAGGEGVTGRAFDQHAGADDVQGVLTGILAGYKFARRGFDFEFLDDATVELNVLGLATNFIEIIGEVHAEAGGENREVDEFTKFSGVVNYSQHFLHAPEREYGNEKGAATLDGVVDAGDQADHFLGATLAKRAFGGATSGFGDDGIKMAGREARAFERALIGEKDVTGEKDSAVFVNKFDGSGAGDMAGGMKHDLDLVFGAAEVFGLIEIQADHAFTAAINFLVGEERIIGDVGLFALAHHHVG